MKIFTKEQIINIAIEFDEFGFRASNPCGTETNDRIVKDIHKVFNELLEFKDYEEKLDFDLIILLRAFINGIYFIDDDGLIDNDLICNLNRSNSGWGFETCWNDYELLLSDYGITWALSREELRRK